METDKHYFVQGLFVIGLAVAAAIFAVWLVGTGHRDDVLYRIHFAESVSGLAIGDPVTFRGVDVGAVKAISLDAADPRLVQVDVRLRKETPVKTDTKATLKWKGITGVISVELNGGNPNAPMLLATAHEGQVPEIPSEKSTIATVLEQLPRLLDRFASIENQVKNVVTDIGSATTDIKENPSLLLFPRKKKDVPPVPHHR